MESDSKLILTAEVSSKMSAAAHAPREIFVYVDGFNLYHRVLEGHTGRKWLNIRALVQSKFPNDQVTKVRLFTASVDDKNPGSARRKRQETYWRVLRDTGVEIELGRIENRERKCKAAECGRYLDFVHATEKMSDVSMALRIVTDAIDREPQVVCVVSADLDVLPALCLLRERQIKARICVFLPGGDPAQYYSRLENFGGIASLTQLTAADVQNFQFPDPYVTKSGHVIEKPVGW